MPLKIDYVSDLHLDYNKLGVTMPGGDVLVVAGDVCEVRELVKEFHSTKPLPYGGGSFPCYDFFFIECAKYKKVFYVLGNHEHYRYKLWKSHDTLREILPDNIVILEDESYEYEGVLFVGSTLWTNMNRGDPLLLSMIRDYMNDYRVIDYLDTKYNNYRKLQPADTVRIHNTSWKFIQDTVKANEAGENKPIVVITHMAPSYESVHEKYKGELSSGAFASELSDWIIDYPCIKAMIHGHMHDPSDYLIGTTRVVSNPRGYLPWEAGNGFKIDSFIEI